MRRASGRKTGRSLFVWTADLFLGDGAGVRVRVRSLAELLRRLSPKIAPSAAAVRAALV
jgi:hypothetical protein